MTHFTTVATHLLRRALPAAAALMLACPAAAHAAPHRPTGHGDWLYLSVSRGGAASGDTRRALLLCDPPLGHPHAAEACSQLRTARGDIRGIPRKEVLCSMIYAPVTVRAAGRWQGRTIDYTATFANACMMRARTGEVFSLDR
ncbi:SSI family serine proteinase inhibitor [Streptomyces tropicalis]|uniref:SSI family serine proteinase inhibitor n=1 Tax=Streptomyces tropicalis TaxID=3034234 RepID=A0ABT6A1I7_9ACTN|nr:SSI family serine proteinase inhibitor [Streptomyces tropicalis]MDF3298511.1 SSI family serine proteinase inhibitor [Streptomyces tropicalis]